MSAVEQGSTEPFNISLWLKRASMLALLLLPLSVLGFRLNLYPFPVASKLLAVSLILAAATFLISMLVSLKHRNLNPSSSKQASLAGYISLIPLLFLGSQIMTATSLPMIHNISTDVIDPPKFDKIIELRGDNSNPHTYDIELLAQVQLDAYPKVKTLVVKQSKQEVYEKSLRVVESLGWDIVNQDSINGTIEASQTSFLWGFTDDIVVRLVESNEKTKIDLRSVSRIGRSDLGQNAKRIRLFYDSYIQSNVVLD